MPAAPLDETARTVGAMTPAQVAAALEEVKSTFSASSVSFLRDRGAAKLATPDATPPSDTAPTRTPPELRAAPSTAAELAAAVGGLPRCERVKLDWAAGDDEPERAPGADAERLSAAFEDGAKVLSANQRRAAFHALVRECVLDEAWGFADAPARLLEALPRGLDSRDKYAADNARDAARALAALAARRGASAGAGPAAEPTAARSYGGAAWDAAAWRGLARAAAAAAPDTAAAALAVVADACRTSAAAARGAVDGGCAAAAARAALDRGAAPGVADAACGALAAALDAGAAAPATLPGVRAALCRGAAADGGVSVAAAADLARAVLAADASGADWPVVALAQRCAADEAAAAALVAGLAARCVDARRGGAADAAAARILGAAGGPAVFASAALVRVEALSDATAGLAALEALGGRVAAGDARALAAAARLARRVADRAPRRALRALAAGGLLATLEAAATSAFARAADAAVDAFYGGRAPAPGGDAGACAADVALLRVALGSADGPAACALALASAPPPAVAPRLLEALDAALSGRPHWRRAKAKALEALGRGEAGFPPAWILAVGDGDGEAAVAAALDVEAALGPAYAAALPRGARLAHRLRFAARPLAGDAVANAVEAAVLADAAALANGDVRALAAFVALGRRGDPLGGRPGGDGDKRDAALGFFVEHLARVAGAEFPDATRPARAALGALLRPAVPPAVRGAVWRETGASGNAHHVRGADVATCACAPEDAALLVDDVLLALKHDPPAGSPVVALALQHLAAFLDAEPEGSFQRNSRVLVLRESCSAAVLARLGLYLG